MVLSIKTMISAVALILFHGHCQNNINSYPCAEAGIPSEPLYYDEQLVDHLSTNITTSNSNRTYWRHRYYASNKYFHGPGSPIFLIMGGEGEIKPSKGLYYPFIVEHLAKEFGAHVIQPEHRFYGESQPLGHDFDFTIIDYHQSDLNGSTPIITTSLMTSEQAMWDAVRLVQKIQADLGCSTNKTHDPHLYCPVITVGGSYPGFLSAMMRIRHPTVVDMAYAASAPMLFYSQNIKHPSDYYDHITKVAEKSSKGCSDAVRRTLVNETGPLLTGIQTVEELKKVASSLGICENTVPRYIIDAVDTAGSVEDMLLFYEELMMVVGYTFANCNMANYPPDNTTLLYQACQIFQNEDLTPEGKISQFLIGIDRADNDKATCFNMTAQVPSGNNATISSGDWSGVGTSHDGEMWDFQTCTLLVEQISFGGISDNSTSSMFPKREWTIEWMTNHCEKRFGVSPKPYQLVNEWKFNEEELGNITSKILFTNGMNDGWSVGGIQHNISDTILALNFENGAHHSDLSGVGPSDRDTPDIKSGFKQIQSILKHWLEEDKNTAFLRHQYSNQQVS